jgi:glycosyltransferase involved in cell wall biosynthesis
MKKRILWVSEASFLSTGFSVLSHEILSKLYKTVKYEIAELGSYAKTNDPRSLLLPWKFYGATPDESNSYAIEHYNNVQTGQFGESVFEQVCLDFRPDIVVDVRDQWMISFELKSPFRPYYKLLWMPTVDGEPQKTEWLDDYSRADKILTYSKYGKEVLEREAPGRIKVSGIASPGANHEIFRPMDKAAIRKELGIPENSYILMSVMRNQKRKLYPDLMDMFALYLAKCKNDKDLADNSYLYIHTSYPDVGYDLPSHIMRNGIGHKVLMTYLCHNCNRFFADFFQTEVSVCKHCGQLSARPPHTGRGLSREDVAKVINAADLYIQYSICEGFGMPVAEAKACGIPALGVDYTATSEQVRVPGCCPIKVERFFYESVVETEQIRALPDNKDAASKVYAFFKKTPEERAEMSKMVRQDVIKNHSFDRCATVFEHAIDDIEINDRSKTWDSKSLRLPPMNTNLPRECSNGDFVDWCFDNILGEPALKSSYLRNDLIKTLNSGYAVSREGKNPFSRESVANYIMNMAIFKRSWEENRLVSIGVVDNRIKWKML